MGGDYIKLELDMAQAMIDNAHLKRWLEGEEPDMAVRFEFDDNVLSARYGKFGSTVIGNSTAPLVAIGYEFQLSHFRDYLNIESEEIIRTTAHGRLWETPIAQTFVYHARAGDKTDLSDPDLMVLVKDGFKTVTYTLDQEPEPHGGETRATIFAPSGHWAEGVALCGPDDMYDRGYGRTLALMRAFEKLNEVRGA